MVKARSDLVLPPLSLPIGKRKEGCGGQSELSFGIVHSIGIIQTHHIAHERGRKDVHNSHF